MCGDELHGYVHVFVNGRDVPYLEKTLETRISQSDKLDIFPAVGGG
jgi:molybdopterin synthase sulfur carrier subunit